MKVLRNTDGTWRVENGAGETVATGLTNAAAWRWRDKVAGEPLNKSQDTSDWAFSKKANGE